MTTRTADEIIWEAFSEPKQEEPKVELQKVDTAKFVFHWENSSLWKSSSKLQKPMQIVPDTIEVVVNTTKHLLR